MNETRVYHGQNKCMEGNQDDTVICETINEGMPGIKLIEIVDYIPILLNHKNKHFTSIMSTIYFL